jgi:MoaA/NifB/PqqE/SkfB family radical SAM enzyme
MKLDGVHLLLTFKCTYECDHCFIWGSPWQPGTMSLRAIGDIVEQSKDCGSVEWVYFEGGEPLLYYPVLVKGVEMAAAAGFKVGVVSNAYWATEVEDATEWLRPLAGKVRDLSISSDLYHGGEYFVAQVRNAVAAAERLGIPVKVLTITPEEDTELPAAEGLPVSRFTVSYRGRAAEALAPNAAQQPWTEFDTCPDEDLREPGRVHVDPLGNVHLCQGILLGNVFETPLREICEGYDPESHEVVGPLLVGGPAELARRAGGPPGEMFADACHLCFETRRRARARFPRTVGPDQAYGVVED